MFGTVTSGMIADQLKTQFDVTLDKKKIHLEHPIRALGDHEIELRLHQEVATTLKVRVETSTPLPEPAAAPVVEGKKEEPTTEKRGRRPDTVYGKPAAGAKKPYSPRPDRHPRPEKAHKPEKSSQAEKAPGTEKAASTEKAPKPAKAE
jgi:outer membrane biosynthesis protein TonB